MISLKTILFISVPGITLCKYYNLALLPCWILIPQIIWFWYFNIWCWKKRNIIKRFYLLFRKVVGCTQITIRNMSVKKIVPKQRQSFAKHQKVCSSILGEFKIVLLSRAVIIFSYFHVRINKHQKSIEYISNGQPISGLAFLNSQLFIC